MTPVNYIRDPLGNNIRLNKKIADVESMRWYEIKRIILYPAFIISIKGEAIYFIKKLNEQINIMLKAKYEDDDYVVESFTSNPSENIISSLLKKGRFISFHYPGDHA